MKCIRCGRIIGKGEEYREGELYKEATPESEKVGTYYLCFRCFEEVDCEAVGF